MDTEVKNRKETHGLPGLHSVRALQTGSLWVQCQGGVCGRLSGQRQEVSVILTKPDFLTFGMRASYRLNLCGCENGVGMAFRNSIPYPKTPGARQKLGKSLAA